MPRSSNRDADAACAGTVTFTTSNILWSLSLLTTMGSIALFVSGKVLLSGHSAHNKAVGYILMGLGLVGIGVCAIFSICAKKAERKEHGSIDASSQQRVGASSPPRLG